jgi:hypothetical protein
MDEHPVRLLVDDDLQRSRLTTFFRWLLAIPHYIWLLLWTVAAVVVAIVTWLAALATGRPPRPLHGFLSRYVVYVTHLNAYLWLAANPYPGFGGHRGAGYPIDIALPGPVLHRRWTILIRFFLALPALVVAAAIGGSGGGRSYSRGGVSTSTNSGVALVASVLGWFAILGTGRMPRGLRDLTAYSAGYSAQTLAYLLLVTDRYPNSDPTAMLAEIEPPPLHPVHLVGEAHDLRRSRVTTFFRLFLAIPHLIWLVLWGIVAVLASIATWFATLATGRPPRALHAFLSRYVRYQLHVGAFLYLVANPFPAFGGRYGTYPLDLELPQSARQSRWKTGLRIVLAIPALVLNGALTTMLQVVAVLLWFCALVRGSVPWGMRNLAAYALRYSGQLSAYLLLVTDAYPHASPLEGTAPEAEPEHA